MISIRDISRNESEDEQEEEETVWRGKSTTRSLSKGNFLEVPENTILYQYLQDSSLQGVKYIGQQGKHFAQRLFWICTVTGGLVFSAFLINIGIVQPLLSNPILITFHSSEIRIDQIPFPAFTVCSVNNVKKSAMAKWERAVDEYQDYVKKNTSDKYLKKYGEPPRSEMDAIRLFSVFCNTIISFFQRTNQTDLHTIRFPNHTAGSQHVNFNTNDYLTGTQNDSKTIAFAEKFLWAGLAGKCDEMILKCLWKNTEVNCREIFSPVKTRMGRCCVFNMMPEFIMRGYKKDDPRLDPYERLINDSVAEAWRSWNIDEHLVEYSSAKLKGKDEKLEYPRHQKKAGVRSGLSILVNPELPEYYCGHGNGYGFRVLAHSPLESTHIDSLGYGVAPNEEVFVGVRAEIITGTVQDLKNYSFKKRQCYLLGEKVLNNFKFYTKENCLDECLANGTWETCQCVSVFQPREGNRSFCLNPEQTRCVIRYIDIMRRGGLRQKCKGCIPSCTEVNYVSELSTLPLRDDVDLWKSHTSRTNEQWTKDGVSVIHVYFTSDYVESRLRKSIISGLQAFIADTGGLLGLTLGFSLISLVEIVYFFTIRRYFWKENDT